MRLGTKAALTGLVMAVLWTASCDDETSTTTGRPGGSGGQAGGGAGGSGGTGGSGPGSDFDGYCQGEAWDENLVPTTVGELSGTYLGVYNQMADGTLFTMKMIPSHPFQLTTIRLAYAGDPGSARVRLMTSFGRSYPDLDNPEADLGVARIGRPDQQVILLPVPVGVHEEVEQLVGQRQVDLADQSCVAQR